MPITPWQADSLDHVKTVSVLQPLYSVYLGITYENSTNPVTYWDVDVTLNGGQLPYATARFKASMNAVGSPAAAGYGFQKTQPYKTNAVQIMAGYQRGATSDRQMLFYGYITSRTVETAADGTQYVQFEAESFDGWLNFPSNIAYSINSPLTSIKGTVDAINAQAAKWWHTFAVTEESAYLSDSSAYTSTLRSLDLAVGDSVADFVGQMASALRQWVRPKIRQVTTPDFWVCDDPYPYRAATALAMADFTKLTRVESQDQWANVLDLTCEWVSSGSVVSKRKVYTDATPTNAAQIRTKALTLQAMPPGGTMPDTYHLATRWLRRIGEMQEVKYTGTGRAMYWLQPRIDGIDLTDNPYDDTAGPIDSITFHLDSGTQTVTWSASNPHI